MFIAQSCLTLCNPMDCSPPGSSVHGILQARILEWVAIPFSRGSSQARDQTQVSCIASRFFTIWATREASMIPYASELSHSSWVRPLATPWTVVAKSCLTLCNSSSPGSSVHGILQVRILEWVVIPFSRGSFWPRDQTRVSSIADGRFTIWAIRKALLIFIKQLVGILWAFYVHLNHTFQHIIHHQMLQVRSLCLSKII